MKMRHARIFEALIGRKPTGVPLWQSITVVASDKNLREAVLPMGFFVEVPEAAVQASLTNAGGVAPLRMDGDPNRLLEEMTRRLNALQDQVDRLQRSVDQLNRRFGTPELPEKRDFKDKEIYKDKK